jgi:hypothetical protein
VVSSTRGVGGEVIQMNVRRIPSRRAFSISVRVEGRTAEIVYVRLRDLLISSFCISCLRTANLRLCLLLDLSLFSGPDGLRRSL